MYQELEQQKYYIIVHIKTIKYLYWWKNIFQQHWFDIVYQYSKFREYAKLPWHV